MSFEGAGPSSRCSRCIDILFVQSHRQISISCKKISFCAQKVFMKNGDDQIQNSIGETRITLMKEVRLSNIRHYLYMTLSSLTVRGKIRPSIASSSTVVIFQDEQHHPMNPLETSIVSGFEALYLKQNLSHSTIDRSNWDNGDLFW